MAQHVRDRLSSSPPVEQFHRATATEAVGAVSTPYADSTALERRMNW